MAAGMNLSLEALGVNLPYSMEAEQAVLGAALLPLLRQVPAGCPGRETVDRLADALPAFLPLPAESVPETSLLREFLGGWLYA